MHPLRVYVLVLRDLPCQLDPANYPAPLVTRLVRHIRTVQAEVTIACRCVLAPECTSHCSHRSPATIAGTILIPCAARTVGAVSLVPHHLLFLPRAPFQPLCVAIYLDPQLAQMRSDRASSSHSRHCHNWRPSSQPFSATRISVSSFAGTLFCSSSLTRTEPLTALLCSPAITL